MGFRTQQQSEKRDPWSLLLRFLGIPGNPVVLLDAEGGREFALNIHFSWLYIKRRLL